MIHRFSRLGLLAPALAALALLPGCVAPGPAQQKDRDVLAVPLSDDVVAIYQFFQNPVWMFENEQAVGFKAGVYFVSGASNKGVFVPGTIIVTMYAVSRNDQGEMARAVLHEWKFDRLAAEGYRVLKRAAGGDWYGFPLRWPPEVKPFGREIEIVFEYERLDGRRIRGSSKYMQVPAPAWYRPERAPPAEPARPRPAAAPGAAAISADVSGVRSRPG